MTTINQRTTAQRLWRH